MVRLGEGDKGRTSKNHSKAKILVRNWELTSIRRGDHWNAIYIIEGIVRGSLKNVGFALS